MALKLSHCDIYEHRLREQVRRKRVARDYQLVSRFYRENPIVEIGLIISVLPIIELTRFFEFLAKFFKNLRKNACKFGFNQRHERRRSPY